MSKDKKPYPQPTVQGPGRAPKQGCDTKVTIGRVIRGNPYVERNAKPTKGLPDSLPPNKTYQVEIEVEPPLEKSCPGEFIEISIIGGSDDNGTATVTPAKITQTTRVTVTGGKQSKPRNGGNLKIQAALSGKRVLTVSAGFTVCAHPLNFKDVFDSNINETLQGIHVVGMRSQDSWESDSEATALNGSLMDLNGVQIKELVLVPRPKSPPFFSVQPDTSDYELGVAFSTDRHTVVFPDPGPAADWKLSQLSIYKCSRCGCKDIVMPNSGMQITYRVVHGGDWQFFVEKVGAQVMIHGLTSGAANAKIKTDPVRLAESMDAAAGN